MKLLKKILLLTISTLILTQCAAPLRVTKRSLVDLDKYQSLNILELENDIIGEFDSNITNEIMEEAIEDIWELNRFNQIKLDSTISISSKSLRDKLKKDNQSNTDLSSQISLIVTLTEFDKGNGLLRFLFGAFAGSGKVSMELKLIDKNTNESILEANTTSNISGSFSSARDVVGPLSKAIGNFIEDNFVN